MTDCTKTRLMRQSPWTTEGIANAVAAAAAAKTGEGTNPSPSSVTAARDDVDNESETPEITTMSISSGETPAEGAAPLGDAGEDNGSNQGDVREEKKGVGGNKRGLEMGGKVEMSPAEVLQQREIERLRNHTRSLERWVVGCVHGGSCRLTARLYGEIAPLDRFCFIHNPIQKLSWYLQTLLIPFLVSEHFCMHTTGVSRGHIRILSKQTHFVSCMILTFVQ